LIDFVIFCMYYMIWKEVTMKMNFLEKIDRLMFDRGINRHTLAAQSGIPYTTIMGLYTKGYDKVQLSTLKRLCDYFGVSLDYLVTEDIPPAVVITHEEQSLLTTYRTMNSLGQEEVTRYADYCATKPEYQKNTQSEAE